MEREGYHVPAPLSGFNRFPPDRPFTFQELASVVEEEQESVNVSVLVARVETVLRCAIDAYSESANAVHRACNRKLLRCEVQAHMQEIMRLLLHVESAKAVLQLYNTKLTELATERLRYTVADASERARKIASRLASESHHSIDEFLDMSRSYRHIVHLPPEWYAFLL